jgi:hypothetical protein
VLGAPKPDTLHLVGATEVVAVGWLMTPAPLAGCFAGSATIGLAAVVLVTSVAVIREEELSAMEALASAAF